MRETKASGLRRSEKQGQMSETQFHRLWVDQCTAAHRIKQDFGTANALEYLVGEKLLNFVQIAERRAEFAEELPYFLAEIRRVFNLAEAGDYTLRLERTRKLSAPQRAALRAISSISAQIH